MCDFFLFVYLLLILLKLLKVIYVSLAGNYITFSEDLYDILACAKILWYGENWSESNYFYSILCEGLQEEGDAGG